MDAIAAMLDGPRARDAFVLKVSMKSPWSISVEDEASLAVIAVLGGEAWVVPSEDEPVHLRQGDLAVAKGPQPYLVADSPDREPNVVILTGEQCVGIDGTRLDESLSQGVRMWGNSPDGPDLMLIGTYEMAGEVTGPLLAALPSVVAVRVGEWDTPLVAILDDELSREELGQTAMLDRLLDLLLVGTLRVWLSGAEQPASWYRAHSDPLVGPALRLLHHNPAEAWTVARLAAEVGSSRAAFARRFTRLVGEPPITYLTKWRLSLAADRLSESDATIASVATEVGYASPFALSTAFKRLKGISPTEYRRKATS